MPGVRGRDGTRRAPLSLFLTHSPSKPLETTRDATSWISWIDEADDHGPVSPERAGRGILHAKKRSVASGVPGGECEVSRRRPSPPDCFADCRVRPMATPLPELRPPPRRPRRLSHPGTSWITARRDATGRACWKRCGASTRRRGW